MNPCPCGYYGHPKKLCTCTPNAISRYLSKISGPMLDRIDMHIEVPPIDFENLSSNEKLETSEEIRARVNDARKIQLERYKDSKLKFNAFINSRDLQAVCIMSDRAKMILKSAFEKMGLSARGYDKILKISRTIADLDNSEVIDIKHISEAIQYRSLDRKYWQR